MDFDIVTFGAAVIDSFIHTDIYEQKNFIYYPVGEKILIKDLKFDIGGGGTNTAVAFSRLGLKTGCICGIGSDNNGKTILDCLKKENVTFIGKINKKQMSGYSAILDSRGGERTILTYKGANNDISLEDIDHSKIHTKWLYYSSLLEKSFKTQKLLAHELHKRSTKLAFNPSSYIIKNEDISSLLKITDILILNKEELELLMKQYKFKDINSMHSFGIMTIVVTNKNSLVKCYEDNKTYSALPHKNAKVVERTGAGDAFASGFVAGRIAGLDNVKCLELAIKESENVIKYFGAKNELLRFNIKKTSK